MSTLLLLWDESHIWGLLAARAVKQMGLPYVIAKAHAIPDILSRKKPSLFMVPGGNARQKADALGKKGIGLLKEYVASGGRYMGFCGGAGLALHSQSGLGICPWRRASFDDRLQHFMSGHLLMDLAHQESSTLYPDNFSQTPSLPVWWPGRFEATPSPLVKVLATYSKPDNDFWLADLPIASIPVETFEIWQNLYDFSVTPTFLKGQPSVVHGTFGKGSYILAYSHLETPNSPDANKWLSHLIWEMAGIKPTISLLPAWDLWGEEAKWEDKELTEVSYLFAAVLKTGIEHGLLFQRNTWLTGWRTGIPGSNLNNLWALVKSVQASEPSNLVCDYWKNHKQEILAAARFFYSGCTQYLLAERLAITLSKAMPDFLPVSLLKQQRVDLFGPPMQAGGVYRDLIRHLDALAFLQLSKND